MKQDHIWLDEALADHNLGRRRDVTADELVRSEFDLIKSAAQRKLPLAVVAKAIKAKTEAHHLSVATIQRRITAVHGPWKAQRIQHAMSFSDRKFEGREEW